MRIRLDALVALMLAAGVSNCRSKDEDLADRLPKSVEIVALGARRAFDDNWEVRLRVKNNAEEPFRLEDLTSDNAQLKLRDNSRISLHRISVGKAKPLIVEGHAVKNTSLLFTAGKATPTLLIIRGRKIPVSSP
jgi:hypothetical protein